MALGCHGKATKEATPTPRTMDIVNTAVAAGDFDTLVAAVKAADLVGTLKSPGPFTAFAPIDATFAKLPAGTPSNLRQAENKAQLAAILAYHVVPRSVMTADVVKLNGAKTINGQPMSIKTDGSRVQRDNATVVQTSAAN